jgi:hypothetical protein
MVYVAFTFAFALACLATLEFVCMMTLDSANRALKKRVLRLERANRQLEEHVSTLESQLASADPEDGGTPDEWPEFIEDTSAGARRNQQ